MIGLILLFGALFIIMCSIGACRKDDTQNPDCDNCEYASECRKRIEMMEGMREDSNK